MMSGEPGGVCRLISGRQRTSFAHRGHGLSASHSQRQAASQWGRRTWHQSSPCRNHCLPSGSRLQVTGAVHGMANSCKIEILTSLLCPSSGYKSQQTSGTTAYSTAIKQGNVGGFDGRNLHHASEIAVESAAVAKVHESSEHIDCCTGEKSGENHAGCNLMIKGEVPSAGAAIEIGKLAYGQGASCKRTCEGMRLCCI